MRPFLAGVLFTLSFVLTISAAEPAEVSPFPVPLQAYDDGGKATLWEILRGRAAQEPFNVVATAIFLGAIVHTFLASKFMHIAHRWRDEHAARLQAQQQRGERGMPEVSFRAEIMHFFGEVEAIFGLWIVPLLLAITWYKGWGTAEHYVSHKVNFTEPLFVVIIMALSATRPVLRFAEQGMSLAAKLGGRTPAAWWFSIMTIGPLLGSFITEPAAMTLSALLLARRFYEFGPSSRFKYATLGLLFVNVSIGGTLTHFAAPPVLMVAGTWNWDLAFMFTSFGWKAATAIGLSNALYFAVFRGEFSQMKAQANADDLPVEWSDRTDPVPAWVTVVHLGFLGWTVFMAHHPVFFVGGFLFFLAFATATEPHQNPLSLKPAILVGFFLAGLVVHGGLQGWWIAPVLGRLSEMPLALSATLLTAFNDNAAITYLATLVPNLGPELRYAVVVGAVAGGGLTVIANAPNPAGQSILSCYFKEGIAPLSLLAGALIPTVVAFVCLMFLP